MCYVLATRPTRDGPLRCRIGRFSVFGQPYSRAKVFYSWVVEPLLEYQDYVLAYRLRAAVGGKTRPARYLSLSEYAGLRLERQALAKDLLKNQDYRVQLREIEALTDRLNFGFWHNPSETIGFIKRVIEQGGCAALESPEAFVSELLTRRERAELSSENAARVARYYLGLLRASASYLDAEVFTRLRAEIEPLREGLPFFVLPKDGVTEEVETL